MYKLQSNSSFSDVFSNIKLKPKRLKVRRMVVAIVGSLILENKLSKLLLQTLVPLFN